MTPFLQLSLALATILLAAKASGYLSMRLGQPAVLGELLAGIILGPSLLDVFHLPYYSDQHLLEVIKELGEIGVLLLMFLAGLDLHLGDMLRLGKIAGLAGSLGVAAPLLLGTLTGLAFGMSADAAIFLGLALSATSVSISAQTLMELKVLRSRVGMSLLGAAVFDHVLVILGLSLFTALNQPGSGGAWQALWVAVRMLLYLAGASLVGWWLLPRLTRRVQALPISQGLLAFVLFCILVYAWLAEVAGGMAAITGAFLAGLWFSRSQYREAIHHGISPLAYGLFVPIFFIDVGLSANLRAMDAAGLGLLAAVTLVAAAGKIAGSGWGGILGGLNRLEGLQLGVGMMSRGEVGLIVATVGMAQGLVSARTFSALVGMIVLTTLLTPPLLRRLFHKSAPASVATGGAKPNQGDRA